MQAAVKLQSTTEGDPSDSSSSYFFSISSSRRGSDSSMGSNIDIRSHEQQENSTSKMNSSSSNKNCAGSCDGLLSHSIRDRLSLSPSYERSFSSYSSSVDIGLGLEVCSMAERMERDNEGSYSTGSRLNCKTCIPHPLNNARQDHTHSPGNRTDFLRSYRHSPSTGSTLSSSSPAIDTRLQGVSASLRSVRFTSFPCRPQLSMQRNAVFNVVTTQSQEFNKVRSARNLFSSENSERLSSHTGSLDVVDEKMKTESNNMNVSVQFHARQRRNSFPDFMVDGMREIQMFKKRQKVS